MPLTHRLTKLRWTALMSVAASAWILGYPTSAPGQDGQQPKVVQIVDFMRFEPEELEIPVGATVEWVNLDGSNHNITLPDGTRSGRMHMDARWSHTFTEAGVVEFGCAMHPHMSGRLVVRE